MIRKSNTTAPSESNLPFWKEDQEILATALKPSKMSGLMVKAIGVFMVLAIFGITFGLVYQVSHIGAWGVLVYFVVVFGTAFIATRSQNKKQELLRQEIEQIQARASEKAGASLMGSAVHVAGSPRIEREQKIVLALTNSSLDFYTFDHDHRIDRIPLSQIIAIHTIVYDEDQTPHMDAIDNAAQALQITVKLGEGSYDCLFRNMRKVHPIDWYQAIQNARIQVENTHINGNS